MKKLLAVSLSLVFVLSVSATAQNAKSSTTSNNNTSVKTGTKRGPIFRASKEQINQAQSILKGRGFYSGEQTGKLDKPTRDGLEAYQKAEGLRVTGTLNKVTLEKMGVELTEKQKTM